MKAGGRDFSEKRRDPSTPQTTGYLVNVLTKGLAVSAPGSVKLDQVVLATLLDLLFKVGCSQDLHSRDDLLDGRSDTLGEKKKQVISR